MHDRIRNSPLLALLITMGLITAVAPRGRSAAPPKQFEAPKENGKLAVRSPTKGGITVVPSNWRANINQWRNEGQGDPADNSYCIVCHVNYKRERLVTVHKPAGVGCETCHGISDKHSEDEDNLVPPDVMFSKRRVAPFCMQCHEKSELISENDDHKKLFETTYRPGGKSCTDCHSMRHSLKTRTRRWNKETRELQSYDGVRMMQQRDAGKK